jgi:[acyl-carrier-protein] S-malonyltransferase
MKTAFLFPGQGSQIVGMGADWAEAFPAAREVFEQADDALGFAVSALCWHGPEEDLQLTANTQPAILTASIAVHRVLVEQGHSAEVMAGHSLGEYSALVASGSLTLADALMLVRRRGELMQEAVPVGEGAMAAVMGLDATAATALAETAAGDQVCAVANFNSPVQTVLSGHSEAIDRAVDMARDHGARRAVRLAVSAPFHSPLMASAREGLTPLLEVATFFDPRPAIVNNVDATDTTDGEGAREGLRRQIASSVRWVESVERMHRDHGVERFVEVGPGSVLAGLVRRIVPGVETISLTGPEALERLTGQVPQQEPLR